MPQLEPLNLKLTGSADGLVAALGKSESKVGMFGGAIGSIGSKFSGMLAGINPWTAAVSAAMATVTAGAAAAAFAISNIGAQFKPIDDLADAAAKLGLSFNELKGIRLAIGEATGLEGEAIDAAISKLQLNLSEAASTMKGAAFDRLSQLGLDATELIAEGPIGAIEAIASKVSELKSPTDQLRVAFDLFGKSGVGLVNALRDGQDSIRETVNWAEQYLGLTDQQVEAVGRMNDKWDRIAMAIDSIWQVLAGEVAPAVEFVLTTLGKWLSSMGGAVSLGRELVNQYTIMAAIIADTAEIPFGDFNFDKADKWIADLEKIRNAPPPEKLNFTDSQLSEIERESAAIEAATKKADALRKEFATPAQKFAAKLAELQEAVNNGSIDWELYANGVRKVTEEMQKAAASASPKPGLLAAVTDRAEQIRVIAERQQAKADKEWQDKMLAEQRAAVQKLTELISYTRDDREPAPLNID